MNAMFLKTMKRESRFFFLLRFHTTSSLFKSHVLAEVLKKDVFHEHSEISRVSNQSRKQSVGLYEVDMEECEVTCCVAGCPLSAAELTSTQVPNVLREAQEWREGLL